MTTTTRTVTKTKYIRSLLDFDPKFLAPFAVLIGTIVIAAVLTATGTITIDTAAAYVGPVFLAAAAAYVATSSHRAVLEEAIEHAGQVLADAAPIVEQVAPETVPAVQVAQDAVADLQAQLAGVAHPVTAVPGVSPTL